MLYLLFTLLYFILYKPNFICTLKGRYLTFTSRRRVTQSCSQAFVHFVLAIHVEWQFLRFHRGHPAKRGRASNNQLIAQAQKLYVQHGSSNARWIIEYVTQFEFVGGESFISKLFKNPIDFILSIAGNEPFKRVYSR
jgi:hypothetical protein